MLFYGMKKKVIMLLRCVYCLICSIVELAKTKIFLCDLVDIKLNWPKIFPS